MITPSLELFHLILTLVAGTIFSATGLWLLGTGDENSIRFTNGLIALLLGIIIFKL